MSPVKPQSSRSRDRRPVASRANPPVSARRAVWLAAALYASALALGASPSRADDRLGMPAYVWAQARTPSDLLADESRNSIVEMGGEAAVEWRGQPRVRPSLFVDGYLSRDRELFDYNNKLLLAGGAQVQFVVTDWLQMKTGAKYEWDNRLVTHANYTGPVGFAAWETRWPSTGGTPDGVNGGRFWIRSQGDGRYPSSQEPQEKHDGLLQGRIEADYDLWRSPSRRFAGSLFQEVLFKTDTQQIDRYNLVSAAAGLKLRVFLSPRTTVELGAALQSEHRFVSRTTRAGGGVFVNFVAWRW